MWALKKLEQELIEQGHLPAPKRDLYADGVDGGVDGGDDGNDGIPGGDLEMDGARRQEVKVDLRCRNA